MRTAKRLLKQFVTNGLIHEYISKAYRAKYPGSQEYWDRRYKQGGTSGEGSYGRLAEFKADVLESFIEKHDIETVIEFGCGDGNQLSLVEYPEYTGLDVSPTAISRCISMFGDDDSRSFFLYDSAAFIDNNGIFKHELSLSLDVIYHLTEDELFEKYMTHLFGSAERYVIVYSSNSTDHSVNADHVKHREFTKWVKKNAPEWSLINTIENKYPYDPDDPASTSWSNFKIFENIGESKK